jgi:hypothetical protein
VIALMTPTPGELQMGVGHYFESPFRHESIPRAEIASRLAFLTAVIAKMDARSAVDMLTFCDIRRGQDSGEFALTFDELRHEWPGRVS